MLLPSDSDPSCSSSTSKSPSSSSSSSTTTSSKPAAFRLANMDSSWVYTDDHLVRVRCKYFWSHRRDFMLDTEMQELNRHHHQPHHHHPYQHHHQQPLHPLQQHHQCPSGQQPLPAPATDTNPVVGGSAVEACDAGGLPPVPPRSVSILVYKTLNSVFKSGRKVIVRACEVASVRRARSCKMFNLYSSMKGRGEETEKPKELETTGHDRFCQSRPSRNPYRKKRKRVVQRAQSAAEFDNATLTAASKRNIFKLRSASSEQEHSDAEHSEKSPLVSTKLETFAKLLFNRSIGQDGGGPSKEATSPTRHHSLKCQYSALDSGGAASDLSPRDRASRERALGACQEWLHTLSGRYEIISHLDDIGSRAQKNWFLLNDSTIRTDRLMTLLPIPADCVALDELPPSECPKGVMMELLGSLQHPYIYPVLDLGFLSTSGANYACLVMPFNLRGSLKDLIHKAQWNEPNSRKYTRKSACLPLSQVQRLGRQILEALLFLRERGFPSHGHLHSGNVILQNGVARLSGLENGLLGLNSRVNAVMWSRNVNDIENMDIICFGHLLFEMCAGYELNAPQPTAGHLQLDLEKYPQVVEVLQMIFEAPEGRFPTVEDLVLCDLFRNIDLREMRGPGISSFKHGLSNSTLNLLSAVRRRQGASLGGSYSEGSSPCTPPSTPRDRRTGSSRDMESFDMSSDSDGDCLDEIVITPSSFDVGLYDLQNSPIHICDPSRSADELTTTTTGAASGHATAASSAAHSPGQHSAHRHTPHGAHHHFHFNVPSGGADGPTTADLPSTGSSNQLTTDSCCTGIGIAKKNSSSRRKEYSMRGQKSAGGGGVNNPSQDSAFGSMTDGEQSIASSSFRLSSFQSISSPIDEGVEDVAGSLLDLSAATPATTTSTDSHKDSLDAAGQIARSTSDSAALMHKGSMEAATPMGHQQLQLEPPKILVNDQSSCYTTSMSPSKTCATVEVFSQKYRVSSFEDMSLRRVPLKKCGNKLAFRSLEEERRIESAFQPSPPPSSMALHQPTSPQQTAASTSPTMASASSAEDSVGVACSTDVPPTPETTPVRVYNNEKFKKLTHAAFSRKITSTKERHTKWKNSILARKNVLIKSNESLISDYHHQQVNGGGVSCGAIRWMPTAFNGSAGPSACIGYRGNRDGNVGEDREAGGRGLNQRMQKRVASSNELFSSRHQEEPTSAETFGTFSVETSFGKSPRKSRSERQLLTLCSFRQKSMTNGDYDAVASYDGGIMATVEQRIGGGGGFGAHRSDIVSFIDDSDSSGSTSDEDDDDEDDDDDQEEGDGNHHSSSSNSHRDMCQIIGGFVESNERSAAAGSTSSGVTCAEENRPLLDGMEMSPISPVECSEML